MSFRKFLSEPKVIYAMMFLQFIPMVLFPPDSFTLKTQEWWLPALLGVLAIIAIIQIFRRSVATWPWNLIGFSQGFNIISRLLMIFPHSTYNDAGQQFFNGPYVAMSLLAMGLSAFLLWYTELPEVRMGLFRE
jgi:hypothetical protein